MKTKIVFLINPISGGKNKSEFPTIAARSLDLNRFNPHYFFTEGPGHATKLAMQAITSGADVVVAVGGDGTINETATVLRGSGKYMGIIPYGSGNGLARSLNIPLNTTKAIKLLNRMTAKAIDTAEMNGHPFFNMAGLGFDAHISSIFASNKRRGLGGYLKATLAEVLNFDSEDYVIQVDGVSINCNAYMISIANSSQYGNNAHISPHAALDDGLLDICILYRFPLYRLPELFLRMFRRSADHFTPLRILRGKRIEIRRNSSAPVHIDGEPLLLDQDIQIKVAPLSLNILI